MRKLYKRFLHGSTENVEWFNLAIDYFTVKFAIRTRMVNFLLAMLLNKVNLEICNYEIY